jgi:signal transduction histidine kinase
MDIKNQSDELLLANRHLIFQNQEIAQRAAADLVIANKELIYQNQEKEKRAAELKLANMELAFQNREKEKRAAELILANIELDFQDIEKEKRAAELIIANIELDYQYKEKEKRAAELMIANKELVFQNQEKEKRAAELSIANKELIFQNQEKEKRAAELIIANKELVFQNREKEKRAAELIVANKELVFQNQEKEKRAAELILANIELVYQNKEKEKRAIAEAKKDEILNLVGHELKTPLTNIKAINQLLEKTADKKSSKYDFLLKSKHNIQRLERLVEDMLDVTRFNTGRVELVKTEFNITDVLIQSISTVQQISPAHQIILESPVKILYRGDQFRIEQVIINLLTNAIKYSPNADKVIVSAKTERGGVLVCVEDFGIGIVKEDLDQLFDRFFRVDKIAMAYQGLGLGLYISSEIVKKHGGKFHIESEPGKGSKFSFRLPLTSPSNQLTT